MGSVYPYGNDEIRGECYQPGFITAPPVPVGPIGSTGCAGGYPGLVDMVGVPQYVDSCTEGYCAAFGSYTWGTYSTFGRTIDPQYYPMYLGLVAFRCCGVDAPR